MSQEEKIFHVNVVYRGKTWHLNALAGSTLGALGNELVDLTGVAPHTLRLMLPKRPPLQPMSQQHYAMFLSEAGIVDGMTLRMMGSSSAEVATVSQNSSRDQRILGFSEEEERAKLRSGYSSISVALPKGNYVFCDFRTLELPGIVLSPPPSMALKIMHKLASDRGIIAIMNKHRWRVGVMSELAPVGYVGISPKCLLGFNRNHGEEISLRLRTDDLNGFRKYDSIKKTLLHELAHMVHSEHDEHFHALDKQLNEEAIALDWTKARGNTLSRVKFENDEDEIYSDVSGSARGHKLGGNVEVARVLDPRTAAAAAALRRLGNGVHRSTTALASTSEHSPDEHQSRSLLMGRSEPDADKKVSSGKFGRSEPDPDLKEVRDLKVGRSEPDPDLQEVRSVRFGQSEPDPDLNDVRSFKSGRSEPDPDLLENHSIKFGEAEPDPDLQEVRTLKVGRSEPDPDLQEVCFVKFKRSEPDPDLKEVHSFKSGRSEPDPDLREVRSVKFGQSEPDPDLKKVRSLKFERSEPDPDLQEARSLKFGKSEPDLQEARSSVSGLSEPDPDKHEIHSNDMVKDGPFASDTSTAVDVVSPKSISRQELVTDGVDMEVENVLGAQGLDIIGYNGQDEPDPDELVDYGQGDITMQCQEPNPYDGMEELPVKSGEPDPDEMDVQLACTCRMTASNQVKTGSGSEGLKNLFTR